jgi:hypothetical protein
VTNLSPEALRLLHVHAAGGWELVAQHQREGLAAARTEAAKEPATANAWRPVETMPRDGREVIVFRPLAWKTNDPLIAIAKTRKSPQTSPQGVEHYTDRWCHPTHWMPLPVDPEPAATPSLRAAAEEALCLMDRIAIASPAGGNVDRVQKLLRDALGEAV